MKYGFRSKVTLVENKPCLLGSTCRGIPSPGDSESSSIQNKLDLESFFGNSGSIRNKVDVESFLNRIPSDFIDRQVSML